MTFDDPEHPHQGLLAKAHHVLRTRRANDAKTRIMREALAAARNNAFEAFDEQVGGERKAAEAKERLAAAIEEIEVAIAALEHLPIMEDPYSGLVGSCVGIAHSQ